MKQKKSEGSELIVVEMLEAAWLTGVVVVSGTLERETPVQVHALPCNY
jgi:hypothetical protein